MARRKSNKLTKKDKRNLIKILVIVILLVIGYVVYPYVLSFIQNSSSTTPTTNHSSTCAHTSSTQNLEYDDISIHFLELGNEYTGDCVYIKAGENDILIDAGSRKGSAATIASYIDNYVDDGVLEYVIATHAHQDHIAGFVGTSTAKGIFDRYECEVIIDYSLSKSTSQIRKDYEAKRDEEVNNGATHYTAKECVENNPIFDLADGITMKVLDQKYYHEEADDENDHSVCLLFTQNDNNFLFTGDLEYEGELSLVEKNDLPHCRLFKGGHHGSYSSTNTFLLEKITPEVVCVCCCAGSDEYTTNIDNMFPSQNFVNRVAPYTSKIYVTSKLESYKIVTKNNTEIIETSGVESMNGNIVVTINESNEIIVNGSNNNTKLKDSEWFNTSLTLNNVTRTMRTWPNVTSMYN